jgi:energy-coupling factor transporter transmembrane protein EcfT
MFFVFIVVFFIALALSFVKKQPLRKIAATVAAVTGGLFILGLVFGIVFLGGAFDKEPPTLLELQKRFPSQHQDLETILRMANEDARFSRIAPIFLDQSTENGGDGRRYMQDDAFDRSSYRQHRFAHTKGRD